MILYEGINNEFSDIMIMSKKAPVNTNPLRTFGVAANHKTMIIKKKPVVLSETINIIAFVISTVPNC